MTDLKLYMVLLGSTPPGRSIEQHDIFFGIAEHLRDLVPAMKEFWPEAQGRIHIDAWRQVKYVNGYEIIVQERAQLVTDLSGETIKLFFLNLGGYKPGEFEEYHYKMVVAASDRGAAIQQAKKTAFFRHTGYKGARAHLDDKYGIDVDDVYVIDDILPKEMKEEYCLTISTAPVEAEDEQHIGYFKLDKI